MREQRREALAYFEGVRHAGQVRGCLSCAAWRGCGGGGCSCGLVWLVQPSGEAEGRGVKVVVECRSYACAACAQSGPGAVLVVRKLWWSCDGKAGARISSARQKLPHADVALALDRPWDLFWHLTVTAQLLTPHPKNLDIRKVIFTQWRLRNPRPSR